MHFSIRRYYTEKGDKLECIVCRYQYRKSAPVTTFQKHLRVKHKFSMRYPIKDEELNRIIQKAQVPIFIPYHSPPEKPKQSPPAAFKRVTIKELLNNSEAPQHHLSLNKSKESNV
ncbi:hypothetical protein DSO57_1036778 [Entomophthora muscae]|uniref:Uncharacterized protein n=1 Tax=Entomophthora muscae TaxID=34485 RepID=A0ACC2SZB6_9FUNG|nr:hypothetical protein DSO57_1036778 [Entomophthora muscae]